jgi:hypothetical protein
MKKEEVKRNAQAEAETAKQRLIDIEWELMDAGLIREANSLATIIEKLERWQNK